jgi:CDP-glycerol glycerophosphotransferase
MITTFERILHRECYVLVRLHPNLIKNGLDTSELVSYEHTFDATKYNEMQELLVASDVLITDYSSSMFDFAYINKPVFLYAVDAATYDRDTYFELEKLPFPFSKTQDGLEANVEGFDMREYHKKLTIFLDEKIGSYEKGYARQSVYDWMQKKALK